MPEHKQLDGPTEAPRKHSVARSLALPAGQSAPQHRNAQAVWAALRSVRHLDDPEMSRLAENPRRSIRCRALSGGEWEKCLWEFRTTP